MDGFRQPGRGLACWSGQGYQGKGSGGLRSFSGLRSSLGVSSYFGLFGHQGQDASDGRGFARAGPTGDNPQTPAQDSRGRLPLKAR